MDAVEHYLYGIAIDEDYGGNRPKILALDVLHPEVCKLCELKIISHQASIICMKLMIYLISNEHGMKREEATKYYMENVIVVLTSLIKITELYEIN